MFDAAPVRGSTPGDYPFGRAGATAVWDGEAWTGHTTTSPSTPAPIPWKHRFLPFLRHRWFWIAVLGVVVLFIPAYIAASSGASDPSPLVIAGGIIVMYGATLLVVQHLSPGDIGQPRLIAIWGIISGLIAGALASLIEGNLEPRFLSENALLWQSGITEETLKLLVPVILLAFGGATFRTPRAGLFLVLVSGATFGVYELADYALLTHGNGVVATVLERSTAELLHPYLTAFAAVLIWLGAWRRQRTVTAVGIVGWLIAIALHSLHDGLMGLGSNPSATDTQGYASVGQAVGTGVEALFVQLLISVIFFLILRHAARELVPPTAIATNSPHWRPQIKQWGVPKEQDDA